MSVSQVVAPEDLAAQADRIPPNVSVVYSPQQTIYFQLCGGAQRMLGRGYAQTWRLPPAVVRADRMGVLSALAGSCASGVVPDALVPIVARQDVSAEDQFAAVLDYPADVFQDQLAEATSAGWRSAYEHPKAWLRSYAEICRIAWHYLQPRWEAARPTMSRVVEQVGVASVRGGLDAVLDTLSPRIRYQARNLELRPGASMPIGARQIALAPSLCLPTSYFITDGGDDVVSVAYPVRSIMNRDAGSPPADAARLILGGTRADLLRVLQHPWTVGEIASELQVAPSTISRHCDHLESAGLVARRRRGQCVEVVRTASGTALLDALAGS